MKPRLLVSAAVAATALMLAGCGEQAEPDKPAKATIEGNYVGPLDDSAANVGLVIKDGRLAGFVCQDEKSSLTLAPVDLKGDTATLQAADGAVVGSVTVDAEYAAGEVEFEKATHPFTAQKATGDAGVYRLPAETKGEPWTGWVVLNDGSYTGNAKGKPTSGSPWINPDTDP